MVNKKVFLPPCPYPLKQNTCHSLVNPRAPWNFGGERRGGQGGGGRWAGGNRGGQFTQGRAKRVPQAPRRWRRTSLGSCPNLGQGAGGVGGKRGGQTRNPGRRWKSKRVWETRLLGAATLQPPRSYLPRVENLVARPTCSDPAVVGLSEFHSKNLVGT